MYANVGHLNMLILRKKSPQKKLFHLYHGQTHWRHDLHRDLNLGRKTDYESVKICKWMSLH